MKHFQIIVSFAQTLTRENFDVELSSPISFKFTNLDQLSASLLQPDQFSGIIFSSPRTVQAVQKCLPDLKDGKLCMCKCYEPVTI